MLIFQGDRDDYGTAQDAKRYQLSTQVHVTSVHAGHDYDALTTADEQACLNALKTFLQAGADQA
jgi:predicted alpha/beta-hydrolase family hydrolase